MIFEQRFNLMQKHMYSKVDVQAGDEDDIAKDPNGYTGQINRFAHRIKLDAISEETFLQIIREENRMSKIMLMIRGIDKERNGYVTTNEMDDILKEAYPDKLASKDLKQILKGFTSIQNPILLDYTKFRDAIMIAVKDVEVETQSQQRY